MNLAFRPKTLDKKTKQTKSRYQQVVILPGLHAVGRDFTDEFSYSGIRVIHKISVNENILISEMVSSLKEAMKHVYVYCFHGKHFTFWDLRGMLETDNFANKESILASVSFWPLLIIESVAHVSQHVLFTHYLLVKEV